MTCKPDIDQHDREKIIKVERGTSGSGIKWTEVYLNCDACQSSWTRSTNREP